MPSAIRFAPLGDSAIVAHLPGEATAIRYAQAVRAANFDWLVDVVPAYSAVGIHFDADRISVANAREILARTPMDSKMTATGKRHCIPCCYEMQLDLKRVAEHVRLSAEEVIALHCSAEYAVYAIGFCPGFPYLGYLPTQLRGVPRLDSPRVRVPPGSVGMTGQQTGLYPLERPGGWNLIGRTPLLLVDVADGYFPIRVGDLVRFERIDETEYERLRGERL